MGNPVFEKIMDSFYEGHPDYKLITDSTIAINEEKDSLISDLKNVLDGNEANPNALYDTMLLAVIHAKEAFPVLVNIFNRSEKKTDMLFGDTIYDIMDIALFNTFDGNYHLMEETLTNGERKDIARGVLFRAYAGICITNNKSSKLVNFIKANLDSAPYEDFYDDIVDVYLDYKLDSLTVVVKELWLKKKLDVDYVGPYSNILDEYLTGEGDTDNSILKMFERYAHYSEILNLPERKPEIGYYEKLDEFDDELAKFLNETKCCSLPGFISELDAKIDFSKIYPLNEIQNELTTVKSDIEIDYMLYKYFKVETVAYDNDIERDCLDQMLNEYYDMVIKNFEKYLKNHNFTYDDYDNSRSIHFTTSELYSD